MTPSLRDLLGVRVARQHELVDAEVVIVLDARWSAESSLLEVIAAGDHVEEEATARDALVGGSHLRRERRGQQAGPEGDEELEPRRDLGQPGRHDPGAPAP
jgi:hypothetical protein